jgi:hypothetical protein
MPRTRRNPARSAAAGVLVLVVALLLPTALAARWVHDTVGDTDGYVAVAEDVAADPDVQGSLVEQLTTRVTEQVPTTGIAAVDTGVRGVVEQTVGDVVRSDTFASVWAQANRAAHQTVLGLLTGDSSQVQLDADGQVVLDLSGVADAVSTRIVESGLLTAEQVPTFDTNVPLFESSALDDARTGYEAVSAVSTWAPWVAALALVLALALAYSRGLVLLWTGLLSAATTGLVMLGVGLVAERATLELTSPTLSPALVGSVADVFTASAQEFLRTGLMISGVLVVLGVVVLLVERAVRSR